MNDESTAQGGFGFSRRSLLMGCALLATGGVARARMPQRRYPYISKAQLEAMLPKLFRGWHAADSGALIMPPQDELSKKLYEHIVTRVYSNDAGEAVMFLVAYNSRQIDEVQVHRPEVCYRVAGFDILSSTPTNVAIPGGPQVASRVVEAQSMQRKENILYWTRVGKKYPLNWGEQRIAMLEDNVAGYYPDGVLVRMSSIQPRIEDALPKLKRFANDLWASTTPAGRRIIFQG
ncbi:exosortase-associated protein EpsI, V-type [Sphingobium subterraneum]|uniref:exosortase-associated protein EpsI, V-type n=1 Tax=Sphingobium subterraneum TaxID=627688 RepID=UPI001C8631D8|nr:exosortase-associated protein EpsI, V-type [Sphingobium subterraneum]